METFNPACITHIHQDGDALTIMFVDGRRVIFTGTEVHPVIPELIFLERKHLLGKFDC